MQGTLRGDEWYVRKSATDSNVRRGILGRAFAMTCAWALTCMEKHRQFRLWSPGNRYCRVIEVQMVEHEVTLRLKEQRGQRVWVRTRTIPSGGWSNTQDGEWVQLRTAVYFLSVDVDVHRAEARPPTMKLTKTYFGSNLPDKADDEAGLCDDAEAQVVSAVEDSGHCSRSLCTLGPGAQDVLFFLHGVSHERTGFLSFSCCAQFCRVVC